MKATMDKFGVITLKAETSLESYALGRWAEQARIQTSDLARNLGMHWDPRMLIIDGSLSENKQEELL